MNLLFLGPPGAGKGTQARRVATRLGIVHLSTGDMLREAVRSATPVGVEVRAYLDRGELVPDAVVGAMAEERLAASASAAGYVLDGYPRNVNQATDMDGVEKRHGRSLDAVVVLEVPDAEIEGRLTGRRTCPGCGAMYHIETHRPNRDATCDACGGQLTVRSDDRPEVVRDRIRVYHDQTRPLVDHYAVRGIVRYVDGTQTIDQVTVGVLAAVGQV